MSTYLKFTVRAIRRYGRWTMCPLPCRKDSLLPSSGRPDERIALDADRVIAVEDGKIVKDEVIRQ